MLIIILVQYSVKVFIDSGIILLRPLKENLNQERKKICVDNGNTDKDVLVSKRSMVTGDSSDKYGEEEK